MGTRYLPQSHRVTERGNKRRNEGTLFSLLGSVPLWRCGKFCCLKLARLALACCGSLRHTERKLMRSSIVFSLFQMRGPGKAHQNTHEHDNRQRKTNMVKDANRQKAEHDGVGRAPEPDVLMQEIERDNRAGQPQMFHRHLMMQCNLRRNQPRECGVLFHSIRANCNAGTALLECASISWHRIPHRIIKTNKTDCPYFAKNQN